MGGGPQYGQSGGYRPPQGGLGQPQAGQGMGGIGGAPGYSLSGAGEGGRFGGGNAPPALNYGGWGAPPNAGIGGGVGGASPVGDGLGTIYAEQRTPGAVLDPIEWDRNGKIGLGGMAPDAGIGGGGVSPGGDAGNGYAPPGAYGPRWATWQGPFPGAPGVYKPKMNTGLEPGPWGGSGAPIQSPIAPAPTPGAPPALPRAPIVPKMNDGLLGDANKWRTEKTGDELYNQFQSIYSQNPMAGRAFWEKVVGTGAGMNNLQEVTRKKMFGDNGDAFSNWQNLYHYNMLDSSAGDFDLANGKWIPGQAFNRDYVKDRVGWDVPGAWSAANWGW